MKPLISFVMPTRDRGNIIGESIQSLIEQNISDWELIVVNDHGNSEDRTKEVIDKFNDDRIKYFELEDTNGTGIAAARNFGNRMATADIVAVCDSDDLNYPERANLTLEKFKSTDCDFVYAKISVWNPETGELKERGGDYAEKEFNFQEMLKADYVPHPTCAYKKYLSYDFPYNSFFQVAEDYDLIMRMANYNYKFCFIDKPLVKYRSHDASAMKKRNFKFSYGTIIQNRYKKAE